MTDEDYCLLMAQVARARRDEKDVDYWMEQAGKAEQSREESHDSE